MNQLVKSSNFTTISLLNLSIKSSNIIPYKWSIQKNGDRYSLLYRTNDSIKYYSGAGTIILERYYRNKYGENKPAIILFRSSLTGEYEDLGGGIDIKDYNRDYTLLNTAKRETLEESANLFNFNNIDFGNLYFDMISKGKYYRYYVICLQEGPYNNQWSKLYNENRILINNTHAPSYWRETNDMQRFYLYDIFNHITQSNISNLQMLPNIEGEMKSVRNRTLNGIKKLFEEKDILNTVLLNPIQVESIRVPFNYR